MKTSTKKKGVNPASKKKHSLVLKPYEKKMKRQIPGPLTAEGGRVARIWLDLGVGG